MCPCRRDRRPNLSPRTAAFADSELVVLALGRLGGRALTHASDLDLIYLFTGDHLAESDGPRPLGATTYYNRLAQRVTAAMSVPTAAGKLYDVDTRLRPQGAQGPLVVTLDSFERYQREEAWTWEHMALLRARPVYGSDKARAEVERIIAELLATPRDRAKLDRRCCRNARQDRGAQARERRARHQGRPRRARRSGICDAGDPAAPAVNATTPISPRRSPA